MHAAARLRHQYCTMLSSEVISVLLRSLDVTAKYKNSLNNGEHRDQHSDTIATGQSATMNPKVYQFFLSMFAAFGSFLYGYDLGVIASVVAADSFKHRFLMHNATALSGTIVALFTAGQCCNMLSSLPSKLTGHKVGFSVHLQQASVTHLDAAARWYLDLFCCKHNSRASFVARATLINDESIVGGILQTAAAAVGMMLAGRLIAGFGSEYKLCLPIMLQCPY
jgi:hypothetical protein